MKFNIDFSFIIAILVLVQLFLLSLNVGTENSEEIDKIMEEEPKEKVNNNAYVFETEVIPKVTEMKEKMIA